MVDFTDTKEEATFRTEVRDFIEENSPRRDGEGYGFGRGGMNKEARKAFEAWRDALVERGWIAPHWPEEYGGAGLSVKEQFILNQELAEAGTGNVGGFGVMMLGPTLIIHGTEEQKQEHLSRILKGEVSWCQGWSEPGAGSDLASLQCRATRDGDDYIVNGSKIWTSGAHRATHCILLTRTDPEAPKHRGITTFLIPMDLPGITVTPIRDPQGIHYFNQVFFDDVRIPADTMVGEENRGWYVATTTLDFERSGIGRFSGNERTIEELIELAGDTSPNGSAVRCGPILRHALADLAIANKAGKNLAYKVASMQHQGLVPNQEASASKLLGSELVQRIYQVGMRLLGLYGPLDKGSKYAPLEGHIKAHYVNSLSHTIRAGSSEIQRNIIATRGLGLPRG